ncbi:MAG: hypothetical protein IJB27_00620 [Clostridia bacterium]|nr:hypothetical protein [Clostridia bacterium]
MTEHDWYDELDDMDDELEDEFDEDFDEDDEETAENPDEYDGEETAFHEPVPVDMTKEEYIAYSMAVARRFGVLRMQKMSMIMFVVYAVIIGGSLITYYAETGIWDWMMLVLLGITLLSSAVIFTIVPWRVKKTATASYEAGNVDGYYGELTVSAHEIVKTSGDGELRIPLNESTMYLEDSGFMAFTTQGMMRGIVLPARCVTPSLAAAIRKAVFGGQSRMRRIVVHRMQPLAVEPIAVRESAPKPETFQTVRVRYENEEIQKMLVDTGWKQYVQSLPIIVTLGIMLGTIMAMMEENLPAFFVWSLGTVLVMFLLSTLTTRAKAKRAAVLPQAGLTVELNEYGVVLVQHASELTAENRILTRWSSLTRAVERRDCVDITSEGRLIRIPKRCILDLDEFRNIVDAHYPPKSESHL